MAVHYDISIPGRLDEVLEVLAGHQGITPQAYLQQKVQADLHAEFEWMQGRRCHFPTQKGDCKLAAKWRAYLYEDQGALVEVFGCDEHFGTALSYRSGGDEVYTVEEVKKKVLPARRKEDNE